jgi:DNA replication and repair protein RecF
VEPNFAREWSRYSRALRQRNAALKLGSATAPWDDELAPLAESLTQARQKVLAELAVPWAEALQGLDLPAVTLQFHRGWSVERSFAESLALNASRDRERGSTGMGPHRFDVLPKLAGRAAREVLSRGQQKLLGAAMALSIAALVADRSGATPTLLVDDPAAELDERHTAALLQQIRTLEGQLVFTSLSRDNHALGVPDRWFHVEHGEVNQL